MKQDTKRTSHSSRLTDFPNVNEELYLVYQAIDSSRAPTIITDCNQPDDPIVFVNQAFLDLTGYGRKEVVGRNCRFLQGPDTDPESIAKLREAVRRKEFLRIQIYNYKKDGTPFWNDLIMSPVMDTKGEVTHFIGLQTDDTERKEREEELRKSREDLARSNQELEQFAYVASHDLQEPLRMIISYLQLIESRYSSSLDDKGRKFIGYAVGGGKRMQDLISDLLTFSRVRNGDLRLQSTDMNRAAEDALQNLQFQIKESDAQVTMRGLPVIQADQVQMTQLLQNLIGNSLKYRSKEIVATVDVSARTVKGFWEFTVKDNGIGIEPEYHARIFNIFQRLHTREEYPGTGIGLAICRRIVERYGGSISVRSELGRGSSFTFTVPVSKNDAVKPNSAP